MTPVWLQFLAEDGAHLRDAMVAALRNAGLEVAPSRPGMDATPGIVAYDRPSPAVCERVRMASAGGLNRVLAVRVGWQSHAGQGVWEVLQSGASDVLTWDGEGTPAQIVARLQRWAEVDEAVESEAVQRQLVGSSPEWRSAVRQVVEVARFTSFPVLITGESGTGKELVANLIHHFDARPDKPELVVMDCTTVVPTLSGSEFFGHERGAFTGAVSSRDGAFAAADGGTLFLDEVGELSPALQAELLRVVQEGMYKRVGSLVWRRTNFRLVCATNRDLRVEEARGRFRRDLYYRIAAATVHLPSLRERRQDIVPLFRHFLAVLRPDREPPELEPAVTELLAARDYPGNVRDLRQLAVRVCTHHVGPGPITVGDIPEEEWPPVTSTVSDPPVPFEAEARRALAFGLDLKGIRQAAAEAGIRVALEEAGGNLRRAAQRLGVTERALQLRRAASRETESPEVVQGRNGSSPSAVGAT